MNKRFLALLLCVSLLCSVLPVSVWATSETTEDAGAIATTDWTEPETTEETIPEATEETVPDTTEETTSETVPEATEETIPEVTEETTSETTPEAIPETTEETTSEPSDETAPGTPEDTVADTIGDTVADIIVGAIEELEICPECGLIGEHTPECPNAAAELMATVVEVGYDKGDVNNPNGFPKDGILANGTTYKLVHNITNCQPLYVPAGAVVTIDLNGWMLEGNGKDPVITVKVNEPESDNYHTVTSRGKLIINNNNDLHNSGVSGGRNADGVWIRGLGKTDTMDEGFITNHGTGMGIMVTGDLVMNGGYIVGCQSDDTDVGAAICGTSTATIEITDVTVKWNRTTRLFTSDSTGALTNVRGCGGVVHSEKKYNTNNCTPYLKATGCTITENSSLSLGGAVSGGNITLNNCTISKNKALYGGGVYAEGSLSITGGSINENVSVCNGGGIYTSASETTISGTTISGNTTSKTGTYDQGIYGTIGNPNYWGGGIYVGPQSAKLTLTGATVVSNNYAYGSGGGIYCNGTLYIKGTTDIHHNETNASGGGVYVAGVVMESGTVRENTSASTGGGIGATFYFKITGGSIYKNIAGSSGGGVIRVDANLARNDDEKVNIISNCTISANESTGVGGGVFMDSYSLEVTNATISGNKSTNGGAGIYMRTGKKQDGYANYLKLGSGAVISGNEITGTTNQHGGGIYSDRPVTMESGSEVSGNFAGHHGGGIYCTSNSSLTINGTAKVNGNTAKTGGGGGIYSSAAITITGAAQINSNKANSDSGGGICCTSSGSITITGAAQVNSNTAAQYGGGIRAYNVKIAGTSAKLAEIKGNTATTEDGGGIYGESLKLTISYADISENKAPKGYGGGIFAGGAYETRITNSKFDSNVAQNNGGAIYGGTGTMFDLINCTVTGNSATNGGGVYQDREASAAVAATTLTLDNTHFNGNTATQLGGGVYTEGTVTATNGCEFGSTAANTAGQTGGAIYGDINAVIQVTGGTIANNTATTGGGIGGVTGSQITVNGTQVTNNIASGGDGGGIYCQTDGSITVTGATITGNKSLGPDNQHGGRGGGIYCGPNTPLSVTNTDVSDNEAYVQGGGIWVGTNVTATLTGVTVTGNKILTQTPGNDLGTNFHASGGGIYTNGTNLIVDGDSQITGNTALYWGGGIYAGNKVTLKGNTLIENNSTTNNGGGVYSTGTADVSGNVVFRENRAHSGGGMYAAHVIITGTESNPILFAQNHALVGSGGGISATQDATIQYVTAENNDAVVYGGGIYCHMNDEVGATFNYSIANSTVRNNTVTGADSAGGGIFLQGTTTVTNCTVSGNTALNWGGGIYVAGSEETPGSATITGGEIKTNRAGIFGGGVCVAAKATLNMSDTLVDGNDAIEMLANTPLDNKNTGRGGGICVIGTAEFTNVTLQNNRALRYGGGLHVWDGGNATWHSGTIQKNIALYGGAGGIHAEDAQITIKDATITENEADEVGGGIHINNAKLIIESANITENIVHAGGGGGIHANVGSKLEIQDGIVISGNEAHTEQRITAITMVSNAPGAIAAVTRDGAVGTGNGGGLCVAGGKVTMTGGIISENTAEGNGGGVAVRNLYYSNTAYDAEFDMISGSITNNTAGNLGGGIYADGEANTPNKTKVYIGVENCTGEGPKHTSTHTDKTHPVVTANNADIGGGVAVEAGATVTVYCANVNGNSATNDGRGDNVYSAGDALVLHDAATVGETTNHQLVVVSGIFQKAAQAVSVNLHYYQTNLDTTPGNTAQATAGEYFNLPDPSLMWSGNGIFLGWTFNGPTNTASPYVRKPSDYNMTMGTPLQAVDATDGHDDAEDAVHMYAVWAPQSSKITYTGCYIDGTYKSDALVTLESGTYNYNEEQSLFTLPNVEMAGYTFQGWYLYQDEGQNANWGYEKSNMLRLNAGQQLDLGSGHFGDITLIPIYTENEVQISYHVSVPTGGNPSDFGYLTQGGNKINSGYAENVKVVTGKPGAVTAIANYRYIFKGWYADGVLITEDPVLTNAHLRKDAEGQLMSEEYYAVFDYHLDDLVINCAASGFFSGEQNFIYEVWCDDTLVTVVTLRNGESVTVRNLLINKEYTVKMMADWSWRFMGGTAAISKQITLEAGGKSVSFTSNQQRDIWLTHDTFVKTGNG